MATVATAGDWQRRHQVLATWLLCVAGMVFVMVVIGGLTRLTQSGLSMVDWRPITGWLPPLSEAEWRAVFAEYRKYPEYQLKNAGMTLAEFKGIFWLEYIHRLWGRLLGVAFAVPFAVFLVNGWVKGPLVVKLVAMFVLGGLQGVLGWFMVKSGLVDRPDVSQYRLTAHLGAAIVIYGYVVWVALGLMRQRRPERAGPGPWRQAAALTLLVFVTSLSGGFVAGLDAGYAYNTFPLMDGELVPGHLFSTTPAYLAPFEDVTTTQFVHRVLALVTLFSIVAFWLRARHGVPTPRARLAVHLLVVAALVQVALGISTLLLYVPVALGALHQAGAMALFTAALWATFELRPAAAGAAEARLTSAVGRLTPS